MLWDSQNLFVDSGDFVIAGFISIYFTVILLGFQMFFAINNGVFVIAGSTVYGLEGNPT